MKERIELSVEKRTIGKSFSRAYRRDKKVPAVIYGSKVENMNLTIEEKEIKKYNTRAFENALFNLKSSDKSLSGLVVLLKDVVVHPVTQRPTHVDLYAIDVTKTIRVWVEIVLEGRAIGISEGGLLNTITRQIEVECLPTAIPENFKLDINELGVGQAKHVSDIALPAGVKLISSADLTVVVCNKEEEKAAATPEAAAATPAAAAAAPAAAAAGAKKPEEKKPAAKK